MKLCRRLVFTLFAWPLALAAGTADTLVQQALAAEAHFDAKTALGLYLKADAARPDDPFILEKISRQYCDSMIDTASTDEKTRRAEKAVAYAKRAVALKPNSAVNLTSLAVSYGRLSLHCSSTRTRIAYSRLVKDYAERALALDPDYDWAYHVLGRWNYEVASLDATERFFARLAYGGLPTASTAEAVRLLRHAVMLAPKVPAHHVELGFAYLADRQPGPARAEFEQGIRLPLREKYDIEEKARAKTALENLR